jgi:anaerobic selenocysteine-containing dehydrogenase
LEREHSVRLNVSAPGTPFLPFAEGKFGTASGKFELLPEVLAYEPPVESRRGDASLLAKYPLEMISPKNDDSMNSTFGNRPAEDESTSRLAVNPRDADPRGITEGDLVRVFNGRGSLRLMARVTENVTAGVVSCPSSRWAKLAADRRNANALTSERLTDVGNGPCFYSTLVEVERCGD